LLLPACVAITRTLFHLVLELRPAAGDFTAPACGFVIGFVFWIVLFFVLPPPARAYVLAHELTHALWGLAMGARVRRLQTSSRGGSVTLSKNNFLITLAPYFFPLYTFLVFLLYYALSFFFTLRAYEPFWLGLMGLTWAFHLTFTITTLRLRQPDIQAQGRVFSWTLIYFVNLFVLGLWIVFVAQPTLGHYARLFGRDLIACWSGVGAGVGRLRQMVWPVS
ncbi:MAG: hypothetical protein NTV49_14590, partial [Kiritimatiellaeota bacterium]|nr:hypothetical protein [Kiritimatiellota bacterium]